jgi:murein DD-endopeptidase MepM/ murein hydrolase activator NlpD
MSTDYPLRLPFLVTAATVLVALPVWAFRLDPADKSFYYPLPEVVPFSSPFGWRVHPVTGDRRFHAGVDLAAPAGLPVQSAHSGTVVFAGWKGGYGNAVIVRYADGQYETLYGHMSALLVKQGQFVQAKQTVGKVGSTGLSSGPHLHFELRRFEGGQWVPVNAASQLKAVEAYVQAKPPTQSPSSNPTPVASSLPQSDVPDSVALSFAPPFEREK